MFSWARPQTRREESRNPAPQPKPVEPVGGEAAPEPPPPEPEGSVPARRFTDSAAPCATRLGRLQVRGMLTGTDSVELSGTFDGPITVDGFCRVNEGGRVTGDVTAEDAVIAGDVQGRVTVIGRLEMWAHARVLADVEAGTVAIAEGCFIEGRIHMRGSESGSQPTTFREKRRRRKRGGKPPAGSAAPPAGAGSA